MCVRVVEVGYVCEGCGGEGYVVRVVEVGGMCVRVVEVGVCV